MKKITKAALTAVGAVSAVAAIAGPAAAGTPLPPDGVDKYDCMVSLPLVDQKNPLVIGALACSGSEDKPGKSEQAPGQDKGDMPGHSEDAPGQQDK